MCVRNGRDFLDFARYFLLSGAVLSFAEVGKVRMGRGGGRSKKERKGGEGWRKISCRREDKISHYYSFFSAGKKPPIFEEQRGEERLGHRFTKTEFKPAIASAQKMANKQRSISVMRANAQERKKIEGNGDAFPEDEARKNCIPLSSSPRRGWDSDDNGGGPLHRSNRCAKT